MSAEPAVTAEPAVYSDLAEQKVKVSQETKLYALDDGSFIPVGTVPSGVLLDSAEAEASYLRIKGTDYYLEGAAVETSDRWFHKKNRLLTQGKMIVTASDYTVEDFNGNAIATIERSDRYTVYAEPCEDDPRYGVMFADELLYIRQDDVSSEEETDSDGQSAAAELPVLMYHFFYSEENGEERVDGNYVEVEELREQLNWLQSENYVTLTMEEVLLYMQGRAEIPARSVAITIDDGDPTVHEYAYPVFREYGMQACLFLITGWGDKSPANYDFWEMREDGLELQSHGFLMHQGGCEGMGHGGRLLCIDHDEGVEDTRMSFDAVDGGYVYCYPFGDVNDNAKNILKDAGTLLAFTTAYGKISPGMDMLELPRIRVQGGAGIDQYINSIEN